jgi:hypothetical protein
MRYYEIEGNKYPSVTSILGDVVPKPWLANYIKAKSRECFWDMVNNSGPINSVQPVPCQICNGDTDIECEYCQGQRFTPTIIPNIEISDIQYCLDAHKRHSDKALEIGSFIHNIIESFHKAWDDDEWFSYAIQHYPEDNGFIEKVITYMMFIKEFYPEYHKMNATYFIALKDNNIKVLESEQTVWHPMGYAGTLDLICEMDGKLWIGDIKTFESKAYKSGKPKKPLFKKEHYAQIEAYRRAYNEKIKNEITYGDCRKCKWVVRSGYDDDNLSCSLKDCESEIKNRFILWLDKRDQSNYYLEIIEESLNEKHWDMWCTAFNQWKAWK